MRMHYRLDFSELLELNFSSRYQRMKGGLVAAMGIASILVGVWMLLFSEEHPDPTPVFFSGAGFVILGCCVPWLAGFGVWFLGRAPLISLNVNEDGIHYSDKE